MKKLYVLATLLIIHFVSLAQTKTLDFTYLSSTAGSTQLGTTTYTATTTAGESWKFSMTANNPEFWTYNDQRLWFQSGDFGANPTDLGQAKVSAIRADGQNFNFKSFVMQIMDQDQYLRIEGRKGGTVIYTQDVHPNRSFLNYTYNFTNWNDIDEVVFTIWTNADTPFYTSDTDFYMGLRSMTYDASPQVTTAAASAIAITTATFNGNLVSTGSATITEKGFVYSTTINPTTANTKAIVAGTTTGAYTSNATGLTANTTYHVRAYATNSVGTAYGADQAFTTLPQRSATVPTVGTLAATNLSYTTATLNANVNDNHGTTTVTFDWGPTATYGNSVDATPNEIASGTGGAAVTAAMTNLNPNTTYYFRVKARNSAGSTNGASRSFTTLAFPTVNTSTPSTVTVSSAVLGGNVNLRGGSPVTDRGVVYGTALNPTTADTKAVTGTGTGVFSGTVTGLLSSTLYHVRAYATNDGGTSYGADLSFTTEAAVTPTPTVSIPENNNTIYSLKPAYSGTAQTGSTVTVYVDNVSVGTSGADGSGNWTFTQPTDLNSGSHTVYATAQLSGYNVSANSNTNTFTVAGTITVSSSDFAALSTTYGTVSAASSVTVTGTALSAGIIVTPSSTANFEVSADGTTFGSTATLGSGGAVSGSVYVRLKATAPAGTDVTGTVTLSSTGATSQTVSIVSGTVSKATLTYTAALISKVYGAAIPLMSATVTGFVNSETMSSATTGAVVLSTPATGSSPVGSYAINGSGLSAVNYTFVQAAGNATALTITAKTLTVTATGINKSYDATNVGTVTLSDDRVPGDVFTISYTSAVFNSPGARANIPLTVSGISISGGASANYTLGNTTALTSANITQRPIVVTADAKSKEYGTADPALTYTYTGTLLGTDAFTGNLSRFAGVNIGNYAISQGTLALSSNYSLSYTRAFFTITAKPITVTADAQTKVYGEANPALTYTVSPALVTGDAFTGTLLRAPGENAGNYNINQGSLNVNGNYSITYVRAFFTISAKTITVTAEAKTKIYGDADPALSYTFSPALQTGDNFSGNVIRVPGNNIGTYAINQGSLALSGNYSIAYTSGLFTITGKSIAVTAAPQRKTYGEADPALTYTFSPALQNGDSFSGTLIRAAGQNAGTYTINQGSLALNPNYSITYTSAVLNIDAKEITVTADAKSKAYSDADPALTYTFSPALQSGDSFSGNLSRVAGENNGTYAINQGSLTLSANYTLNYSGANLTIGKRTILVQAAPKSKTYGDADPALTYTFSPALQSGDSFSGSLIRTAGQNTGTYTINQGSLALNPNYNITYTAALLTIGTKAIAVTADAKTKAYNDADPVLSYTFSPALQSGESFSGNLSRVAGENNGTYRINQGTLALSANYTLNYSGANLTIGKRTILVNAAPQSKTYGDVDPALTFTFSPALQTGDSFSGNLTRAAGENNGTYAISKGTLALNPNYILNYTGADLTIGRRAVAVTATSRTKIYGDADPVLAYTFSPALLSGDTFSGSLTRTSGENAGTYTISKGSLQLNDNYSVSYTNGALTINKAVLTVTANSASMCQSDRFPTFGVTYTGFRSGDNESAVNTRPTISTTANRNTAGTYVLAPSGGASVNYSFIYVNGSLTISALPTVSIVSSKGTDISKGESITLTASGGASYSWSSANGITGPLNTSLLNVRPGQTTTYTVEVANASGCSVSASITIRVTEDYKVVASNILTPNGDGKNDTWMVQNIDMYPNNEVKIFDRNGKELFTKKGYDNSWNGTFRGNDLPEGTYYYIITYGPDKLVQRGFITLIKNR